MKTVWIYVNVDAEPGDVDYLQVFASEEAANRWFEDNDPDGIAFEYRFRSEPHRSVPTGYPF
jgi:hypothetical protein